MLQTDNVKNNDGIEYENYDKLSHDEKTELNRKTSDRIRKVDLLWFTSFYKFPSRLRLYRMKYLEIEFFR